jgi:hypothetical protein
MLNNTNRIEITKPNISSKSTVLNNITTWQTKKELKEKLAAKSSALIEEYADSNLNQKRNDIFDLKDIGIKPKYYAIILSIIANATSNQTNSKNKFNIGFKDLFTNMSPSLINQLKQDLKRNEKKNLLSCNRSSFNRFNSCADSKFTNGNKLLFNILTFED